MTTLQHPPRVTVTVGPPVTLGLTDAVADTRTAAGRRRRPPAGRGPRAARPHRRGTGRHAPIRRDGPGHPVGRRHARARRGPPSPRRPSRRVNRLSRALGRGSGTVAGGRAGLLVDPGLLATLAAGRRVALVTGTNGKTTTTRLLAAGAGGPDGVGVVSNDTGANMPAGHVAALVGAPGGGGGRARGRRGLPRPVHRRDRHPRWSCCSTCRATSSTGSPRSACWWTGGGPRWPGSRRRRRDRGGTVVVANADDPMVAYAASAAPEVRWVGAGQVLARRRRRLPGVRRPDRLRRRRRLGL